MTIPKKNLADLTGKERKMVLDNEITAAVVSFLLYMPEYRITQIRYRNNHKEKANEHSRNYRKKIRETELKEYGKPYSTFNYWTKEEEQLLLDWVKKGKTHQEIAKQLKRSTYSVSKKYARLIKGITNVE